MSDHQGPSVEELTDRAFECLHQCDYEGALELAREIEAQRYTSAYEIAALVYARKNDLERAVETLERGTSVAPTCWSNWLLLGNYRSDLDDSDGAHAAYEQALSCPGVWEPAVRLNQAILANRTGQPRQALTIVESINDPELELEAISVRVDALTDLDRFDEAASLAEKCLAKDDRSDHELDGKSLARVASVLARIRLDKGASPEEVRAFAFDALRFQEDNQDLLALVRDIDGCYSEKAQYFRILIHAGIPHGSDPQEECIGLCTTYDVVAEDIEQAMKMVRAFEVGPGDNYEAIEWEALGARPHDPMGVYWRSPKVGYQEEEA